MKIHDHMFANIEFWKKLGEEYQNPLIVTGTVLFSPRRRPGFVQREQEVLDPLGRRSVAVVRSYIDRTGFLLKPTFVFIDGRTGALMHSETFREELLQETGQGPPSLSAYFELMGRLIPTFLNTLSSQQLPGTRVLLQR